MGLPGHRERERKKSAKLCESLDSFFLSKKRKMADNCTKTAVTFTLPEGEATDSNGIVCNCPMTIKVYRMSIKGRGMSIKGHGMLIKGHGMLTECHSNSK